MKLEAYISCLRMFAEEYNTNNDEEIQHRERNRTHPASLRVSYPRPQAGNRGRFFWRKSRDFCFWFWRAERRELRCGTF